MAGNRSSSRETLKRILGGSKNTMLSRMAWGATLTAALLWPAGAPLAQEAGKSLLRVETKYQNSPGAAQYPNAKAVILEDFISFQAERDGSTVFTEHDVVKVLNENGVEEHSDVIRTYRAGSEEIQVQHARLITPEGGVVEIGKEAISDTPLLEASKLYGNYRKVVIHYPKVVPGSIVEYDIVTRKKPLWNGKWWATSFVQNPDPIVISTFAVKVPAGAEMQWAAPGLADGKPKKTQEGGYDRYDWVVKDSPAQTGEATAPSPLVTMNRVEVTNFSNWGEVASWLSTAWQPVLEPSNKVSVLTAGLLPPGGDARSKAEAVLDWLGKNKQTAEMPVEDFTPHPPASVVDDAVLSTWDAAAMAVAMLRFAGLDAQPVLAFGVPEATLRTQVPRPNRVDAVLVSVRSGERQWWVDPEHLGELLSSPPSGYQGLAFLRTDGTLGSLPSSSPDQNRQEMNVEAYVDDSGRAEVTINLRQTGDSGVIWREAGRELASAARDLREQTLDRIFARMARAFSPRARIHDRYFTLGGEAGEPFDMSVSLVIPGFASLGEGGPPTGAGIPPMSMPLPLQPNERVAPLATETNRQQPIVFPHPFREETRLHVVFPAGTKINSLPPDLTRKTPFGDFYATARAKENQLWYYSRLTVNSTWIPVDQTAAFLELVRTVMTSHGATVSFTPPATPAQRTTGTGQGVED